MSLALYRRYRPETFEQVIGQEHVTGPLQQALASDRIQHAYLFSGPRGCGKTTSARILARALNCEKGPGPTPCGECASCRDLATGGPGSLDVIEIDAASHGGVDDARELRERAFYAPVSSRFKIYIIDEAHMVTRDGFNALLKLVEEPPPHLKFVFATTEPEKMLATIRSRTHHYAFRLVPPNVLADLLREVCTAEGVTVDERALPLIVRAGAGSVRDALSVLDQLVAGAPDRAITAEYASSLLGATDTELLDDVTEAFAQRRGAAVFEALDRALAAGVEPRRFVTDLLDRFRDLLILAVSGAEGVEQQALVHRAPDEITVMVQQAAEFGPAELTRNAELLAQCLIDMRGATSQRLVLELAAARMLLPALDPGDAGLAARLDALEVQVRQAAVAPAPRPVAVAPAAARSAADPSPAAAAPPAPAVEVAENAPAVAAEPAPEPSAVASAAVETTSPAPGALDIADIRRMWPQVVEAVKVRRKSAWIPLTQEGAGPLSVSGDRLTLAVRDLGTVKGFTSHGYDHVVRAAVLEVLRVDVTIDVVAQPGGAPRAAAAGRGQAPASVAVPDTPEDDADDLHAQSADDPLTGEELIVKEFGAQQIGEIQH